MTYEIQHYTLADGWVNTWSDGEKPVTFDTPAKAQEALDDFLAECKANEDGMRYESSEFRIAFAPTIADVHRVFLNAARHIKRGHLSGTTQITLTTDDYAKYLTVLAKLAAVQQ